MKIWIINPYGNLPSESWRPHRSYMASEAFSKKGHTVTYWISNFDHRSKFVRGSQDSCIKGVNVKILESSKYSNHISIDRIKFEINFIKKFLKIGSRESDKPDLIIIGEPSLFVSYNFVKFTKKYSIPFIIDMVDIWPELFKISLPSFFKRFDKIIFSPFYLKRARFLKRASAIISVSKAYLEIAKKSNKSNFYKILYWGVELNSFKRVNSNDLGFLKSNSELWIIYAGTLGDNYDTKTLIKLGEMVENSSKEYKLFIAGDGNLKEFVINLISEKQLKKTIYLGRLKPEELVGFYKNCDIALSTYSKDSTVSMPIKAFDYFAAGLPVLNSLGLDLGGMIEKYKIGLNYTAGDHNDLFKKLELLSNNHKMLAEMKNNNLELAKNFDEKAIYKEYVEFCEEVLFKIISVR
ncbi:MAG: glycosyltransferase family 4 protein [Flavobacteriaceae bacterium]|nr:glycosyltransferase family 4 protein [Flavobacteriaceae bacterium]